MLGKCVEYRILPVNCAGEEYVVENSDIRSKYFSKMILTYVRCGDDFHSKSGRIVARTANGVRQTYEYDGRGQLLAVKDADGNDVERYAYDKAGNMLKKTIRGKTTTFTFDGANQLVSSTTDGVTTRYAYDAAGRLVKEGSKTYRYGYLDKVLSVTDGDTTRTYTYHADGQLASASCDGIGRAGAPRTPQTETFLWDGLALIRRNDEHFINEPHVGGGNPVASSKGTSYFNDMLGTTVGAKKDGKYSAAALAAFGERLDNVDSTSPAIRSLGEGWFTGKPFVEGLGHTFLMRNYRAALAKWQTADPLGYPDGWNQLAYCGNDVIKCIDLIGGWCEEVHHDINETWLQSNNISLDYYSWGCWRIDVLGMLNSGSDWTDSIAVQNGTLLGNQSDGMAYLHAMRSQDQTIAEAQTAWANYLMECLNTALDLARTARRMYANGFAVVARQYELDAIDYLGRVVHTYDDSYSPSHREFQHFSYFSMPSHINAETMEVYEQRGFRDSIRDALNATYRQALLEILRQPE